MNKFVCFDMLLVDRDGMKEPCGKVCYNPESVAAVKNLWDKHDCEIDGVVGIVDRNGGVTVVKGTIDDVVDKLQQAMV